MDSEEEVDSEVEEAEEDINEKELVKMKRS